MKITEKFHVDVWNSCIAENVENVQEIFQKYMCKHRRIIKYTCVYVCVCVTQTHRHRHTDTYTQTHTHTQTHTDTYTQTHTDTQTQTHTDTHTHTLTHRHTHAHTESQEFTSVCVILHKIRQHGGFLLRYNIVLFRSHDHTISNFVISIFSCFIKYCTVLWWPLFTANCRGVLSHCIHNTTKQ